MRRSSLLLPTLILGAPMAFAQPQPAAVPTTQITKPASSAPENPIAPAVPESRGRPSNPEPSRFPLPSDAMPRLLEENLVPFDYRTAELRWEGGRWQLVASGKVLKDFGRRETEARQALHLVRELRLSQHGAIGTPRPVMEYWLSDGRAPQATVLGLKKLPIDVQSVGVEKSQDQWCLRDANRVFFSFGTHADEAQMARDVVKRYGFNQVGFIGQATPSMLILFADPNAQQNAQLSLSTPGMAKQGLIEHNGILGRRNSPAPNPFEGTKPKLPGVTNSPLLEHSPASAGGATSPKIPHLPSARQLAGSATPLPGLASLGETVPFDWRQVQLQREGTDWKLVMGSYTFGSFGSDERSANQALGAVKHYRLSQHCLIGHPKPSFSYFLTSQQAPRGLMFGLSAVPFKADNLQVRLLGDNNWAVCDGGRCLIPFGDKQDEAKHALQAIQRFQFDHLCQIGTGGMTLLVRAR